MNTVYEIVKSAIKNKQQIIATYKSHIREMCPHVIGKKNGREQALFYQFGGTSSSGQIVEGSSQNWRCLPIDGLSNVSTRDGEWFTADNHSKQQTCMSEVDVEAVI